MNIEKLSKQRNNHPLLRDMVANTISKLDELIESNNAAGINAAYVDLPTVFHGSSLKHDDAALYVYSELVKIYTSPIPVGGKGFSDVAIDIARDPPRLIVKWIVGLDESEKDMRMKLIQGSLLHHETKKK